MKHKRKGASTRAKTLRMCRLEQGKEEEVEEEGEEEKERREGRGT